MDETYFLVALDVGGIQDYVFRSNDLKHHLGASELTRLATSAWMYEELPQPNNIEDSRILDDKFIERGDVVCEVIYSGGGNALMLFTDEEDALNLIKKLSRRILLEAPGLIVHIAREMFVWKPDGRDLGQAVANLLGNTLRQRKQTAQPNGRMLGLSVSADCQFTGLPAVDTTPDSEGRRISAEIKAKIRYAEKANARLKNEIDGGADGKEINIAKNYVNDFNDFGTLGQSSYLAVIHADGNRMSKRFENLSNASAPLSNRDYIRAARALSTSVNNASLNALKATTQAIRNSIQEGKIGGVVSIREDKLPFRPIIFGGDDATFVCDGRLGLSVAAKYLQEFEKQTLDEPEGKTHPTGRAGIAIVKTHYPFGKAYQLAEELAKSAKVITDGGKYSAMDWHFGVNGVVMELGDIRARDYIAQGDNSLLMRPVRMQTDTNNWRTWHVFADLISAFKNTKLYPKNKINAFREALRGGAGKAAAFIQSTFSGKDKKPALPKIEGIDTTNGWMGGNCVYFDAIEAMDFFVPLEAKGEK